jgi:hypothetical protein
MIKDAARKPGLLLAGVLAAGLVGACGSGGPAGSSGSGGRVAAGGSSATGGVGSSGGNTAAGGSNVTGGTASTGTSDTSAGVSFKTQILPMLKANCVNCHGPTQQNFGVRVDTYEYVTNSLDSVAQMLVGGAMPPTGPLSDSDRQLFQDWVDQGALDN